MSFNKILVPLVAAKSTTTIFQEALKLAQDNNSQLMLFHSVDWDSQDYYAFFAEMEAEVDLSGVLAQTQQNRLKRKLEEAQDWLQPYVEQAIAQGIATEFKCEVGHPGSLIRDLAQDWNADLIVMGRSGLKGITEVLLGSVSNYILHHAPCSVLIVHEESIDNG